MHVRELVNFEEKKKKIAIIYIQEMLFPDRPSESQEIISDWMYYGYRSGQRWLRVYTELK